MVEKVEGGSRSVGASGFKAAYSPNQVDLLLQTWANMGGCTGITVLIFDKLKQFGT